MDSTGSQERSDIFRSIPQVLCADADSMGAGRSLRPHVPRSSVMRALKPRHGGRRYQRSADGWRKRATQLPQGHSAAGLALGSGLRLVTAALSPELILIAGEITSAWKMMEPHIKKELGGSNAGRSGRRGLNLPETASRPGSAELRPSCCTGMSAFTVPRMLQTRTSGEYRPSAKRDRRSRRSPHCSIDKVRRRPIFIFRTENKLAFGP